MQNVVLTVDWSKKKKKSLKNAALENVKTPQTFWHAVELILPTER